MNVIYRWAREEIILSPYHTVSGFEIRTLSLEPKMRAQTGGIVLVRDLCERGAPEEWHWEAIGRYSTLAAPVIWDQQWIVNHPAFRDPASGAHRFSNAPSVTLTLGTVIARFLERFAKLRRSGQTGFPLMDVAIEYAGPLTPYTGKCMCVVLLGSSNAKPFEWHRLTNFGEFPYRCFECSCGKRWWCTSVEASTWQIVADPAAWDMLLKYNGAGIEPLITHPKQGSVYLLSTYRRQGHRELVKHLSGNAPPP